MKKLIKLLLISIFPLTLTKTSQANCIDKLKSIKIVYDEKKENSTQVGGSGDRPESDGGRTIK